MQDDTNDMLKLPAGTGGSVAAGKLKSSNGQGPVYRALWSVQKDCRSAAGRHSFINQSKQFSNQSRSSVDSR